VADGVGLAGLGVVMVGRYGEEHGLVAGLPPGGWEVALYLDERASARQAAALEAIFLGRAGGTALANFARAIRRVHGVRKAVIDLDHARGRQAVYVADRVEVRARSPVPSEQAISCAIPGHDRPGAEWVPMCCGWTRGRCPGRWSDGARSQRAFGTRGPAARDNGDRAC